MIPIEVFKEKLKDTDLTEEELEKLRDSLYYIAESVVTNQIKKQIENI